MWNLFARKKKNDGHSHRTLQLITDKGMPFGYVEAYKSLRTNLDFMSGSMDVRTLVVTSTVPEESKSNVSTNLAMTLAESGKKMSTLNEVYAQYPQVLVNVTANAAQKAAYKEDEVLAGFIENEQQKLMGMGHVLVRVSGTEPKLRVMVEGQDLEAIHRCADRIVEKINKRILKQ